PHFCSMMLREVLAGGKHLDPALIDKPARILGAVQRIVARGVSDGDFRPVDPLLTHLSLVGSLVFFFATARFRERVLAKRRPAIKPPDAAAYVKHIQDLLTHGLAAERRGARRRAGPRQRGRGEAGRSRGPAGAGRGLAHPGEVGPGSHGPALQARAGRGAGSATSRERRGGAGGGGSGRPTSSRSGTRLAHGGAGESAQPGDSLLPGRRGPGADLTGAGGHCRRASRGR